MTNRYYIEYQHAIGKWIVFESNCKGLREMVAAETVTDAAAELALIEAIDGCCKGCAQNGALSLEDIKTDKGIIS